jgi:hypothetical protein
MARASLRLLGGDAPPDDLRAPIASALLELYGDALGDEELVARIAVLCPIEAAELAPRPRRAV